MSNHIVRNLVAALCALTLVSAITPTLAEAQPAPTANVTPPTAAPPVNVGQLMSGLQEDVDTQRENLLRGFEETSAQIDALSAESDEDRAERRALRRENERLREEFVNREVAVDATLADHFELISGFQARHDAFELRVDALESRVEAVELRVADVEDGQEVQDEAIAALQTGQTEQEVATNDLAATVEDGQDRVHLGLGLGGLVLAGMDPVAFVEVPIDISLGGDGDWRALAAFHVGTEFQDVHLGGTFGAGRRIGDFTVAAVATLDSDRGPTSDFGRDSLSFAGSGAVEYRIGNSPISLFGQVGGHSSDVLNRSVSGMFGKLSIRTRFF